MEYPEIKNILDEHLKLLANAAKNQCSGEELKAITEAIEKTINLLAG